MGAAWLMARAGVSRRGASGSAIAVLLALAAATVLAALAGARRTDSAFPRLSAAAHQADLVVAAQGDPAKFDPSVVTGTPGVAMTGVVDGFGAVVVRADGTLETADISALLAPEDGVAFSLLDRPLLTEGRLPDPVATDEITVDTRTADAGHPVGSTMDLCLFGIADLRALPGGGTREPTPAEQRAFVERSCALHSLRVVGVTRPGPDAVVIQASSERQTFIVGTPALRAAAGVDRSFSFVDVALARGADPGAFVDAVLDHVPADAGVTVQTSSLRAAVVARTVAPYVRALALFGAAMGLATLGVLGPALIRWSATSESDFVALRAIGVRRRQLRMASALRGGVVGALAAVGAEAIAFAVSGRFPIGVAARIEPAPGVRADPLVLTVGALALVILGALLGAIAPIGRLRSPRRSSRLADVLQARGASPAAVTGVRAGLSRDGSGVLLIGVAIAIAAVISALTFKAGLDRLLDAPGRYGWAWDAVVDRSDDSLSAQEQTALRDDPQVTALSIGSRTFLLVDGAATPTFAFERVRGDAYPAIIEGREPHGAAEIALGGQTMQRLHARLGDRLAVRGPDGSHEEVTVVGRTLLPLSNLDQDLSVGEGALLDAPLLTRLGGADPALALLDLRPGTSLDDVRRAVGEQPSEPAPTTVFGPTYTADLRGYDSVRRTPLLLAGGLAVLGAGVLAHVVLTGTRRRRRELAVLRALGLRRRDVHASVRWSALTVSAACLVVSVPLGLALGRTLWSAFAQGIGVSADALSPATDVVAVIVATLALSVLIAAIPGWRAGGVRPAEALRGE